MESYGHLDTVTGVELISCKDLLVVSPEDYGRLFSVCVCVCVHTWIEKGDREGREGKKEREEIDNNI